MLGEAVGAGRESPCVVVSARREQGKRMSEDFVPQMGQFDEIISIIDNARTRTLKAVNAELI